MTWREVLGAANPAEPVYAHNTHNTQKGRGSNNSADIADSAERDSKLLEVLATACRGLTVTPVEGSRGIGPGRHRGLAQGRHWRRHPGSLLPLPGATP